MPNVNPVSDTTPKKKKARSSSSGGGGPGSSGGSSSGGGSGGRSSGGRSGDTVAKIISRVARSLGIPPAVALAIAENESGLNPQAVGDGGTSFGIYQLHQGGELGSHTPQWAYNVANNARQALGVVAQVRSQHPDWDWGAVAAAAQRPADQAGYAANVNSLLQGFHSSGSRQATTYFTQRSSGGGYDVGGSQDLGTPKPLSVKQYLDNPDIQQNYGYLSAFLHNKQIGPILAEAARKGWGANQLLGALSQTKWWKNTAASARSWEAQQKLDPATANLRLTQQTRQVQQLARSTLGFALDPDRAARIANTSIAANWSQAELQHAVGAEFHYHQAQAAYGGAAGQTLAQFKQMSRQYLVPMSDHTIGQWTRQVLEGTYQPQDFQSYLQAQAKSLYPTLSAALDKGMTVSDYLNPYAQLAAQTLEISPDSIDWFHPKWAKALNTTTPDGHRAPMSLSDWGSYLRGLPDYQKTQGAKDQAASLALNIAQTFGKVSV